MIRLFRVNLKPFPLIFCPDLSTKVMESVTFHLRTCCVPKMTAWYHLRNEVCLRVGDQDYDSMNLSSVQYTLKGHLTLGDK